MKPRRPGSREVTSAASEDLPAPASKPDRSRRKFLRTATIVYGAAGAAFAAVPFIESWLPSESARALGGPVDVDISKVEAGQMVVALWRRQPVFVLHRTAAQLQVLQQPSDTRVFTGVPAPYNLPVPPHRFLAESKVRIGENPPGSAFEFSSIVQL
jgi:Rieske Fe-S protein